MLAAVAAEGLVIALLAVLVAGLLRSHAEILRRLHALGAGVLDESAEAGAGAAAPGARVNAGMPGRAVGRAASDLSGSGLDDEAVAVAVAGTTHDTLLAFLSSGCETCGEFWAHPPATDRVGANGRVVIVAKDPEQESPARLRELAPDAIPLVQSSAAWEDYAVPGSPYFVQVHGPTGRVVGEGTGGSWRQVFDLLGQALADLAASAAAPGGGGVAGARAGAPGPAGEAAYPPAADPVDAELSRAGIGPGHPSLYGEPEAGPPA